ncbi:hypothetical protein D3C75_937730 [compost metagenome]
MVTTAYRFIHGGSMRRRHCGRMIDRKICARLKASERAASHWVAGIEATAPRKISATLALAGSARPMVTFSQSGKASQVPATWISKGNTYEVK